MKIVKKISDILSWIVIAAIVIYLLVAAPMLAGYRPVVVLSGSMEPAYPVGSVIYYHQRAFEEFAVGDAVTFKVGESLVTHRVTKVNGLSRTLVTKGDNNPTEDVNPVEENQLAGKATNFSIPYLGYYVTYGKKLGVIIAMAAILLVNWILDAVFSDKRTEKKEADRHEATA